MRKPDQPVAPARDSSEEMTNVSRPPNAGAADRALRRTDSPAGAAGSCRNTIDVATATASEWDVIVIGAGPAGSMAATLLARQGLRTLLVEKRPFPRYKVCGACLNPLSLSLLRAAGLEHVTADAVPLDRFWLQAPGGTLQLDLPGSASLSREQLDARLAQAAIDAGAAFLSECDAKVLPLESLNGLGIYPTPLREVELRDAGKPASPIAQTAKAFGLPLHPRAETLREFRYRSDHPSVAEAAQAFGQSNAAPADPARICGSNADDRPKACSASATAQVVIAADGLTHGSLSRLREFETRLAASSRLGAGAIVDEAPEFFKPGGIYMSSARGGYVGLVRLEDGRLNLAAALDASAVENSGGLAAAAERIIQSAGFPQIETQNDAEWSGTPALTRSTWPLASQRIFLIGDAAGYVEPFTGEGMAWAFASAASVVPLVQQACEGWDSSLEQKWRNEWQRSVGRHVGWCRRLAWLLKRPGTVAAVTRLVATCPWLAQPVLRRLNRESPSRGKNEDHVSGTVRKAG